MSENDFLSKNKSLFWDVKDLSKLNETAIEERILQYGNWENIIDFRKIIGEEKFRDNYLKIRDKTRTNLSKKTICFFNLFLNV